MGKLDKRSSSEVPSPGMRNSQRAIEMWTTKQKTGALSWGLVIICMWVAAAAN